MKKIRSISAEKETWKKLEKIANKQRTSVSAVVRQAMHDKIDIESKKQ